MNRQACNNCCLFCRLVIVQKEKVSLISDPKPDTETLHRRTQQTCVAKKKNERRKYFLKMFSINDYVNNECSMPIPINFTDFL